MECRVGIRLDGAMPQRQTLEESSAKARTDPADGSGVLRCIDFVHHNPGEKPFDSAFLDPDRLRLAGYAGQVLNIHVQAAVDFAGEFPGLWSEHPGALEWIGRYAGRIDAKIRAAREAGIECLAWTDFVVIPKPMVERFGHEIRAAGARKFDFDVKGDFAPNLRSSLLRRILCAQIDAIFERFPSLGGLVVRVGETYLHDLPHHTGGDPILHGVESHLELLSLLRETVCEKHGRQLIYRTWLSGLDEDPEAYLEIDRSLEPHPKFVFAAKHCVGDYHRTHRFTPVLGIGRHAQFVEVQCQREYEGKGAFPNYIAEGVVEGFEEYAHLMSGPGPRGLRDLLATPAFRGVFTWSRGGGWVGPRIPDEFWCALNAEVLSAWCADPSRKPEDLLAGRLVLRGFDSDDVGRLSRICRLSSAAVLRGLASTRGGVDTLWSRDEFLGGLEDPESPMARSVATILKAGRTEEILAERAEAVGMWREILVLARAVGSGPEPLREFIRVSCEYGLRFFEVVEAGWCILLLGAAVEHGQPADLERISAALARWDRAWAGWRKLAADHPGTCPALYRDKYCRYVKDVGMEEVPGMGDSVERIRRNTEIWKSESLKG